MYIENIDLPRRNYLFYQKLVYVPHHWNKPKYDEQTKETGMALIGVQTLQIS